MIGNCPLSNSYDRNERDSRNGLELYSRSIIQYYYRDWFIYCHSGHHGWSQGSESNLQ